MQIPGAIWTALATLVVFAASYFFGSDQIGTWAALAVTVVTALAKAVEVQKPAEAEYSTLGPADKPSKMRRFLLG